MPLSLPIPPAEGFDIVRVNAPMLIGEVAISAATNPEIAAPLPLYISSIQKGSARPLTDDSEIAAWLYPILDGDRVLALAEVSANPLELAALLPPEYATQLSDAITHAESFRTEASYELRVLRVPDASLHAIWLHGNDDHFVPVNIGGPFNLEQNVISEAQLLEAIKPRLPGRLKAIGSRGA